MFTQEQFMKAHFKQEDINFYGDLGSFTSLPGTIFIDTTNELINNRNSSSLKS